MHPSARVLDLFAVPDAVEPIPGGHGLGVRAGDLVLNPDRGGAGDPRLRPVLARLAVRLDQAPARPGVRIAMPIPARDGSWSVDGWIASRYEPGTTACSDLPVIRAAGRLLHAHLAIEVPRPLPGMTPPSGRWADADRVAFGAPCPPGLDTRVAALVTHAQSHAGRGGASTEQLVHTELAPNVLLDPTGTPVILDVAPAWRSPGWADALCVLDWVLLGHGWPVSPAEMTSTEVSDLLRAIVFRVLTDPAPDIGAYRRVLAVTEG